MNETIKGLTHMDKMDNQAIATDFLITAKAGVRNFAWALTEVASPSVREVLSRQLNEAVATHERIARYMQDKGYYHAYSPADQIKADMRLVDTVMDIQI
jgi:similar to spore coat protein